MEVGNEIEFETIGVNGKQIRKACITEIAFHDGLGKTVYTAVTPSGNTVRLSEDEISH